MLNVYGAYLPQTGRTQACWAGGSWAWPPGIPLVGGGNSSGREAPGCGTRSLGTGCSRWPGCWGRRRAGGSGRRARGCWGRSRPRPSWQSRERASQSGLEKKERRKESWRQNRINFSWLCASPNWPFHNYKSLKIRRSANSMWLKNVLCQILKLQNCEKFGRVGSMHTADSDNQSKIIASSSIFPLFSLRGVSKVNWHNCIGSYWRVHFCCRDKLSFAYSNIIKSTIVFLRETWSKRGVQIVRHSIAHNFFMQNRVSSRT